MKNNFGVFYGRIIYGKCFEKDGNIFINDIQEINILLQCAILVVVSNTSDTSMMQYIGGFSIEEIDLLALFLFLDTANTSKVSAHYIKKKKIRINQWDSFSQSLLFQFLTVNL